MRKGCDFMKLSIHGRQLAITDSIRSYTEEKFSKAEKNLMILF